MKNLYPSPILFEFQDLEIKLAKIYEEFIKTVKYDLKSAMNSYSELRGLVGRSKSAERDRSISLSSQSSEISLSNGTSEIKSTKSRWNLMESKRTKIERKRSTSRLGLKF
eukprot:TRINITY_DN2156_c0_g1_i24.p1 TRINITY_DN2156_c0_g1~~TRINITY_DN2156_c0_g1_i24.p1  ORF type:complete len:110 (+),score=17.61 TRINITY_DN2156_c0_g1_i24:80-409(+)